MNWNSKSLSEVNKERIWREIVESEQRDVKIFDRYRPSVSALRRGVALTAPVSDREAHFLDRSKVLYDSVCKMGSSERRSGSSLPYIAIAERVQVLSPTAPPEAPLAELLRVSSPTCLSSSSGSSVRRQESIPRPTSAAEYGSQLVPLVKRRTNPFHYVRPRTDLRPTVM